MSFTTFFLVGGAGFIGSHFVDALLNEAGTEKVTVYDNFSSAWHYVQHNHDSRFSVIQADVKDMTTLKDAMIGHEVVMHFAANPDIARAAIEPSIDFTDGIYLTHQVLEAARLTNVKRMVYASGSGVYGEVGLDECSEDKSGMYPISTYGASKLSSEALICSYSHMFDLTACVFRFANVVGPRQTHGVGYDFIRKLFNDETYLDILGDGSQSKSYIHIQDVISAVLLANSRLTKRYDVYNVATGDYITVQEIAKIVVECMEIKENVAFRFTGGDRGWKGDVPVIRLNTDKIRSLGWSCRFSSAEAIRQSVFSMLCELSYKHPISKPQS